MSLSNVPEKVLKFFSVSSQQWFATKRIDVNLLGRLVDDDGFKITYLQDWRTFVCGLSTLVKSPFQTNAFGEAVNHTFAVREALARAVGYQDRNQNDHHHQGRTYKLRFAAWCIWRQYPSRVYLHCDAIKSFCNKHPNICLDDMLTYLVQHEDEPMFFTSPALKKAEDDVRQFIIGAKPLDVPHVPSSKLDATQNEIVASVLRSGASVIVGGAGVGKTTTIASIVEQASSMAQVVCMAYTHKARRAMASKMVFPGGGGGSTDDPQLQQRVRVSTIHSFIGSVKSSSSSSSSQPVDLPKQSHGGKITSFFRPLASATSKTSSIPSPSPSPFRECLFVLDESSMIDLQLLAELADVIRTFGWIKYQLCFVGDDAQLPPMSRGEIFRQLTLPTDAREGSNGLLYDVVNVHRLTTCYRTNSRTLFDACQSLRNGKLRLTKTDDWEVCLVANDADVYTELRRRIFKYGRDGEDIPQYIAWQNKDVRKINELVQDHLVANGTLNDREAWKHGANRFYKGDKVVYVGDNLKKHGIELTNAMTGIVTGVSNASMTVVWDNDRETVIATGSKSVPAPQDVQLAYCVTVHKSQGSEHEVVIVPCFEVEKMKLCLDRRWLYTAATRAKRHAVIIATPNIESFVSKSISAIPLNSLFC